MPGRHLIPPWRFQGLAFALFILLGDTRESASSTTVRPCLLRRSWQLFPPLRGGTMTQPAEADGGDCCAFTSFMEQEHKMLALFRKLDRTSLAFFQPPDGDGMERLESYETALGDAQTAVGLFRVRLRKWGKHLQKSSADQAQHVTPSLDTMRFLYSAKMHAVADLYECSRLSIHRAWVSGQDFDLFSMDHKRKVDLLNEELDSVERKLEESKVSIYQALYTEDSILKRCPSKLWGNESKDCHAKCFCRTGYPQDDSGSSADEIKAADQLASGGGSNHSKSDSAAAREEEAEDDAPMEVVQPPPGSDDESLPAEDDRSYYAKADEFAERYKDVSGDNVDVPVGDMCMMMEALRRKAADLKALEGGKEAEELAGRVEELQKMMLDELAQQQQQDGDEGA